MTPHAITLIDTLQPRARANPGRTLGRGRMIWIVAAVVAFLVIPAGIVWLIAPRMAHGRDHRTAEQNGEGLGGLVVGTTHNGCNAA